ncbi:hypothetical protein LMG27952_04968 [Paraburkholderia hiiakae]|uniref:Uncharacterized protein n=1 Tax=Paraburkholderia hiiakae TaxID=1081782 RepID=A0ABM8NZ21_9BURK|nr:hypothetical protein LMG27952_04968 [Paraburkholderia hiiakae]
MNSIDAASRYQAEGINADAAQSIVSGVLQERSKANEDMLIVRPPVSDAVPPEREG